MPSFNRITLMGNLTRDPELRHTQNGVPVCNFGLAVNRVRSKNDDAVDFFDCTAWREIGETINNYKKKGEPVHIEGRMEFQQYQDKDGNNRSKHVAVVENVQFLSSGNGGGGNGAQANGSDQNGQTADVAAEEDFDPDIPF